MKICNSFLVQMSKNTTFIFQTPRRSHLTYHIMRHQFVVILQPNVSFRDTSQDALENYFGGVKDCNQSRKPSTREYVSGYATMTVNNITGTNSLHSNCEQDQATSILNDMDALLSSVKSPTPKGPCNVQTEAYYVTLFQ